MLYGPATAKAYTPSNNEVNITMKTNYPFTESINISVEPSVENDHFELALRIPTWCKTPQLEVNGEKTIIKTDKNGFVNIKRNWNTGDIVYLTLPMTAKISVEKEKNLYTTTKKPFPRHKISMSNRPFATVNYGPLLFAFTGDKNEKFSYALAVDLAKKLKVQRDKDALDENFSFNRKNSSPLTIEATLQPIDYNFGNNKRYFIMPSKIFKNNSATQKTFSLVPYSYATKYRMSMFPVAK